MALHCVLAENFGSIPGRCLMTFFKFILVFTTPFLKCRTSVYLAKEALSLTLIKIDGAAHCVLAENLGSIPEMDQAVK